MKGLLTSSLATTDSAIRRVLKVTTDVANLCVEKTLASEVLAVEVLCAPEAAGCDGAALGAVWDGTRRSGGVGGTDDGKAGGRGEGTGKAPKKAVERHDCGEEGCRDKQK